MNERVRRLRMASFEMQPGISVERAVLVTEFCKDHEGKYSIPVLRAWNFRNLCEKKAI